MPITLLADQIVIDGWETLPLPETSADADALGLRVAERKAHPGPDFYPTTADLDVSPVVLGRNTGAACSDWTPTEEGFDTEEVEAQHKHAWRLIYKVCNNRHLLPRAEEIEVADADVIFVAYGSPSRVVKSAVREARRQGLKAGALRLRTLWPFPDEIFHRQRPVKWLSVELNYDGQLVREIQRAGGGGAHFLGRCGELPGVAELVEAARSLSAGRPLTVSDPFAKEAW
jgi:2-oxoglutarate ferredoxin oxidoreductase subunit alpha